MQGRKLSCCKIHRCGNPSKYVGAALPSSQNYRALVDIFIPGEVGPKSNTGFYLPWITKFVHPPSTFDTGLH